MSRHVFIDIARLQPSNHPHVHATFDPQGRDAWLVEDIRQKGVLAPVWVDKDGRLHDGHRRVAAAKLVGRGTVPAVVLDLDGDHQFMSAQLGRTLSTFAKVNLYRHHIEQAIAASEQAKINNLLGNAEYVDADGIWAALETRLSANRRSLREGLTLLKDLEAAMQGDDHFRSAKAVKCLSVFRERGLKPAQQMWADSPAPPEVEDEAEPSNAFDLQYKDEAFAEMEEEEEAKQVSLAANAKERPNKLLKTALTFDKLLTKEQPSPAALELWEALKHELGIA